MQFYISSTFVQLPVSRSQRYPNNLPHVRFLPFAGVTNVLNATHVQSYFCIFQKGNQYSSTFPQKLFQALNLLGISKQEANRYKVTGWEKGHGHWNSSLLGMHSLHSPLSIHDPAV